MTLCCVRITVCSTVSGKAAAVTGPGRECDIDGSAGGSGFRLDPRLSSRSSSSRPRSAPACSSAIVIRVSISLSSTISPETACDALITVARSRCSTGAPIVLGRRGRWLVRPELGIDFIELPHLAFGAPTQIAVAGVLQIKAGNPLEPARRVEICRALKASASLWMKPLARAEEIACS